MNTYKITLMTDDPVYDNTEHQENWSGYTEQVAIAQAFLYHAQLGARKIEVLEISQTK